MAIVWTPRRAASAAATNDQLRDYRRPTLPEIERRIRNAVWWVFVCSLLVIGLGGAQILARTPHDAGGGEAFEITWWLLACLAAACASGALRLYLLRWIPDESGGRSKQ